MPSQPAAAPAVTRDAFAGRYEVLTMLGEGGMGAVYRVRDIELDEEIALKVLHPEVAKTAGALDRFRREVKLARRVTHPNVARVFDVGSAGAGRFLTMELIEGESLTRRVETVQKLALGECLRVASDIARGLAAAHAAGVVHRDLKPDNIMLDNRSLAQTGYERVVVTDFGIAVLAQEATGKTGGIIGTPEYMSPEQVEGKDLDGRTDVYSLGVMLFELLTLQLPFETTTAYLTAAARLVRDAPRVQSIDPSVPDPVGELVDQMLARDRDARPDMLGVVDALETLRGGGRGRGARGRSPTEPMASSRSGRAVSILVTPFGGNPGAAALAESIGDALSANASFRVLPAAAARRLVQGGTDQPLDLLAVGQQFDAELVVDGSLRDEPDQLRVKTRIFDATRGVQTWGQTFTALTQVGRSRLEDDIARAVVDGALAAARSVARAHAAEGDDTSISPEARAHYEKGIEEARQYGDHVERGIEHLREANRLAPNEPHVMSALGAALVRLWSFNGVAAARFEAEDWSLRALATGTRIGQTFNTIGILRIHQGELRAAVDAFREAATRSPKLAESQSWLGRLLAESGHVDEARRRLERAVALDPGDHNAMSELARIAAMEGRWADCDAILDRAASGRAEAIVRATKVRFTMWRGDRAQLVAAVAEIESRRDDPGLRFVVKLLLPIWKSLVADEHLALEDERIDALRQATNGASMRLTMFWYQLLAEVYAVLGHTDAALEAIESASMRALIDVLWLDRCPALDSLRQSARLSRARAVVAARAAALWR